MTRRAAHLLAVVFLSELVLLGAGCSSTPPAGIGTPESSAKALAPVRDRGLELTTLRAELAVTRIAAAKKEAELIELRDLVRQLRLENAESRQAFLDLRERAEQRQRDLEKSPEVQERLAQAHATQDLSVLKETVVTLAQELAQLKQDLSKSVAKEGVKSFKSGSLKSPEAGPQEPRSDPPQRMPVAHQNSSSSSVISPVALTMTAAVVTGPPSTVTVQPGDTLSSLARQHRTTVEVLRKLNALKGDALIVGRELVLPMSQQP